MRETLLLSPGEFFDMLAAVTPPRREDAPAWAEGSD
nr:MAG TPA_asm: hypothetical protein [Caudoviricetes sp.]